MRRSIADVKCPNCNKPLPPSFVDTRAVGGKGGKASGPRKARTKAQATAAVEARWAKYRAKQKAKRAD
jgi:hypothetical protein